MQELTLKNEIKKNIDTLTPSIIVGLETVSNIRKIIKKYIEENQLKSLVIGISGGLDSACVAALCQEKYTGVPLIGISIPMSNTNEHMEKAKWVGENYCSVFEEFDEWDGEIVNQIGDDFKSQYFYDYIFDTLEMTDKIALKAGFIPDNFPKNILKGNMKARIRMITLYDLARKTNGMVLSTDNLSEFQMGFWTICGDVGDYGPIQNIGKGFELPFIAKILGIRKDIISQPPSDGLMVTEDNTDEAQLGASYKEVDFIMREYLSGNLNVEDFVEKDQEKIYHVINRYESLEYKRKGTINLTREEIGI